jgi:hypothetical protein
MITMALKWHHKNISNKFTILKEFWWSINKVHIKWKQKTNMHIIKKRKVAYKFKIEN